MWPLYLFHEGAMTVNFAVAVMTSCRITPVNDKGIALRSLDTKREETFADMLDLGVGMEEAGSIFGHLIGSC